MRKSKRKKTWNLWVVLSIQKSYNHPNLREITPSEIIKDLPQRVT